MIRKIEELTVYLNEQNFSQLFLLVDSNTSHHCMPILLERVEHIADRGAVLLEIPSGEENKTLETVENIISTLVDSEADRYSCLISLGGGVVTDLGGFVSSIYKRGIKNLNIPTTLLSMVDAAIGGKTAINHLGIKNLIGTFNFASDVFICKDFLSSLSIGQIKDGMAEMLKTFLVADSTMLDKMLANPTDKDSLVEFISPCVELKEKLIAIDPHDKGVRKSLNFGHTLGHAVEIFYNLSHGHSVAVGMHYALDLSVKYRNFPKDKARHIQQFIENNFDIPDYEKDMKDLVILMRQDKKNSGGEINFVLLEDVGRIGK